MKDVSKRGEMDQRGDMTFEYIGKRYIKKGIILGYIGEEYIREGRNVSERNRNISARGKRCIQGGILNFFLNGIKF